MRPVELANDAVPTLPVLQHAVKYFGENEKFKPEVIVLIQPTNPLIQTQDIDGTLERMATTKSNSCFSVCEISQRPEWMYRMDNKQAKLFLNEVKGSTKRSQDLPRLAIINGTVYVMKYDTLMKKNKIRDDNTSIYLMPRERSVDIDDIFDFKFAKFLINLNKKIV